MNKFNVEISAEAVSMIREHVAFLSNVNTNSAIKLKEEFLSNIKSLETMPFRYPLFNEKYIPENKYRKLVVDKRYLVLYQVIDETVYVEYVVDCRKDYDWLV